MLSAPFALAILAGASGLSYGGTPLETCVSQENGSVPVQGPDAKGHYAAADGQLYFAAGIRWQDVAGLRAVQETFRDAGPGARLSAVPAGPANRWNLVPAWIVARSAGADRLVQETSLLEGAAVFAPEGVSADCADLLRGSEATARKAGSGLWATGQTIHSAHRPDSLKGLAGSYAIVRGRVVSLGKTERSRYLNFGRFWKTDFTVTLRASDETRFDAALARDGSGRSVAGLAGLRVEVRGTVDIWDGPHMGLRHPEQIVVLEE